MGNDLVLEYQPVTPERWPDLETLFGENGAYGNCWCMWWRLKRAEFDRQSGREKKQALKAIVDSGEIPGLLAYAGGQPIAWCSVAPRQAFPVLDRSWVLKRVDEQPVWSIVCFFVARPYRSRGLLIKLLEAAVDYAKAQGAQIVEGYPIEPKVSGLSGSDGFTGVVSVFRQAGFVEVLRRSESRPIMRYVVGEAG
ncbi:MAG: GNAT family N-acetyltransferase [Anaerolineae bacterium]